MIENEVFGKSSWKFYSNNIKFFFLVQVVLATLCASSLALPCYTGCSGGGGGYSGGGGAHIQGGSQSATIVGPTDPGATIVGPSSQAHIVGPTDPGATIVGPGSQANVVGPDGAHISANEVGGKIIAQPKQGKWVNNV